MDNGSEPPQIHFCETCKVTCTSSADLKHHKAGRKHKLRLKTGKETRLYPANSYPPDSSLGFLRQKAGESPHPPLQNSKTLEQYLQNCHPHAPVIGLQHVLEFRNPNNEFPPHYFCRLCKVKGSMNIFVDHIVGVKHCSKYLKSKPDGMIPEDDLGDGQLNKKVVVVKAKLLEQLEGRGVMKVVMSNRGPPFNNSNTESGERFPHGGPGRLHPNDFPPGMHPNDFPPGIPHGDFSAGMPRDDIPGMHPDAFPRRRYPDCPGRRYPGEFPSGSVRESSPLRGERMRPEAGVRSEFETVNRRQEIDQMVPMGGNQVYKRTPEGSSISSPVFEILESFRIETEGDAQMVLKITQKLTDILMEYRLRSFASVNSLQPKSHEQPSRPQEYPPMRLSGREGYQGPSRYPD
ncbi:uncharacterized protein LOC121314681 [Polyodon spathula]|uniref:uncharacterized protein LOC121314681 n=1 Tax=Polyodon spathula TaxID=7913 RepID=UPI001B7F3CF4|nr:uncharacterized protein LOC121314681 [Polyodon spathula]XP_041104117.1 uncharacterized protein LOC121314681 [Polyodon spathula]